MNLLNSAVHLGPQMRANGKVQLGRGQFDGRLKHVQSFYTTSIPSFSGLCFRYLRAHSGTSFQRPSHLAASNSADQISALDMSRDGHDLSRLESCLFLRSEMGDGTKDCFKTQDQFN